MAVCFFNKDYDKSFECEYLINGKGIEVIVNYDINDEIEPDNNGFIILGINTKFNERDILIIDHQNKINYLLKDAYYLGHTNVWGTPDGGSKTRFTSDYFYSHKDFNKLCELSKSPKIKRIKLYSSYINELIGHPSLFEETIENELVIKLQKETIKQTIKIKKDNIKEIILSDDWNYIHSYKNKDISIKLTGYLEIILEDVINCDAVYDYIREIIIYLQLLRPDKLIIDKTQVFVNDFYCELNIPMKKLDYNNKYIFNSVSDELKNFFQKCYNLIPYRNSKGEVRNIPHIILNTSRNIEDNFLMFYRFIECYYKSNGHHNDFISYSIINNYKKEVIDNVETLTREIISLRNHYAHDGYFIDNNTLEIIYPKIKRQKNSKDYFATDVDIEWIYKRTKILYDIVIDIIFSNMLNYDKYKFNKHF